ncbi:hypothetical protein LCGC14_1981350 [marine sediment metagenome]|uniref:Uncharacterized protein n=1 Tax=marine sediment metagenome TaxID=412755 RepID=A0A0F9FX33_9ZZZZ
MSDTFNSWKQLLRARQGFGQLNEVIVGPQGGVAFSLGEAVTVMGCEVTVKESNKVVINAEVCCPPIEFTNIMGEQDINRPVVSPREDYGRVIWNTNSPTGSRVSWGLEGSPAANLVVGGSAEAKQHELFFSPLVVGFNYEFIVGGCRDFCGDCASSQVYSFSTGVLTEVAIIATFNLTVFTQLFTSVSTTIPLSNWLLTPSSGGQGAPTHPINLVSFTSNVTLAASTVSFLSLPSNWGVVAAITTVP